MIYHFKKKYETLLASSKQGNSIVTLQQYIRKKIFNGLSLSVYFYHCRWHQGQRKSCEKRLENGEPTV